MKRLAVPVRLALFAAAAAGCGPSGGRDGPQYAPPPVALSTFRPVLPPVGERSVLDSAPPVRSRPRVRPPGIDPSRSSNDPAWGYVREKPVKLGGPPGIGGPASERLYISHLRDSNYLALTARRVGGVGPGPDGHVVDLYELTGADGRRYRLYLDMYHPEVNPLDLKAPAGMYFHLPPSKRSPLAEDAMELVRLPRAEEPMRRAEREYRLALELSRQLGGRPVRTQVQRKYLEYVLASQGYLSALVDYAESLEAATGRRRSHARGAAAAIQSWLEAQAEKGYGRPPPAVLMWIYYHLGRARAAAGDAERACREGFDRVAKIDPEGFPTRDSRKWAWQMRLASAYARAKTLAGAATDRAGWRRALNAAGGELLSRPEAKAGVLRVQTRIVRIRCLTALRDFDSAQAEYRRGRAEVSALREGYPYQARRLGWELIQALGPDRAPAEDAMQMVSPQAMVNVGVSFYERGRYDEAVKVWRAVTAGGAGRPFEERCTLGGEPRAWYYLGLTHHRRGDLAGSQDAWEAALIEFWAKMPDAFRNDPARRALVTELRKQILEKCAEGGLRAAEKQRAAQPDAFDEARLRRWVRWRQRLMPPKGRKPDGPPADPLR
ncbi:MAG: tetratricopeptide repeat protein [Planctomycetota bacterium]